MTMFLEGAGGGMMAESPMPTIELPQSLISGSAFPLQLSGMSVDMEMEGGSIGAGLACWGVGRK